MIVLFLCFITELGQSGPKGNSQAWRWIGLGSNQRWMGSSLTGANGEHGTYDASLFQGWFLIFFFSSPGAIKRKKKTLKLPFCLIHMCRQPGNLPKERRRLIGLQRFPETFQNFNVSLLVSLSLSLSPYLFPSCFTWHSVHSLTCFQRTQWLTIMPVHLINSG